MPPAGPSLQGATVLNHVTWSPLAKFAHAPVARGPPTVVAYSEVVEDSAHRVVAVRCWLPGSTMCLCGTVLRVLVDSRDHCLHGIMEDTLLSRRRPVVAKPAVREGRAGAEFAVPPA